MTTSPPPSIRNTPWRERRGMRLLVATGILAGLGVFLLAILVTFPGIVPLFGARGRVERFLAERLSRPVTVGAVTLASVVPPTFEIHDVSVADAPGFRAEPFLTATNLRVETGYSIVLGRADAIRRVSVGTANLAFFRRADGNWNWATERGVGPSSPIGTFFQGSSSTPPDTVEFDVRDSALSITGVDPETQRPAVLFQVSRLSAKGIWRTDRLDCSEARATVCGGDFSGAAALRLDAPFPGFTVRGSLKDVRFEDLLAGVNPERHISGSASGTFDLAGEFRRDRQIGRTLTGNGTLDLRDGRFPSVTIGEFKSDASPTPTLPDFRFPLPKLPKLPFPGSPLQDSPVPSTDETETGFSLVHCEFTLGDNRFEARNIEARTVAAKKVTGGGRIEFGDEVTEIDFRLQAELTADQAAKLRSSRPVAAAIATVLSGGGPISLPTRLVGDIRRPRVEIDYTGFLKASGMPLPGSPKELPIPFP